MDNIYIHHFHAHILTYMYVYSNTLFAVFYITNLTVHREIDENVSHQILLTAEDLLFLL